MALLFKLSSLLQLIVVLDLTPKTIAKFEFTNIKCVSLDLKFCDFEHCYLKSVNRTYKYVSIKSRQFQKPLTKVKINLSLHKRFNGYRPFMWNITVDFCKFLLNQKVNPVFKFYYDMVEPFLNFNHSCPLIEDLAIEKLPVHFVNHRMTDILPFPNGDYMVETNWIGYDINRAVIKFYGTLS